MTWRWLRAVRGSKSINVFMSESMRIPAAFWRLSSRSMAPDFSNRFSQVAIPLVPICNPRSSLTSCRVISIGSLLIEHK